ncbi:MAG: DUF503 domain-containing protein [Acidimicrobiales bacterium]|nr:DUF503 domain-containing protein [Acidimicrobiales bacterium]
MAAHVLALVCDLRVPASTSLKDKRAVVQTICDGARRRFGVAAAETDSQDLHGRTELCFVAASGTAAHTGEVVDAVERFVWSFPEVEVVQTERSWTEFA